uniref:proteinase-activated receptor 1-like n=1 Tax=Scatophagus argus TaxID=75038 RepID=UPI001ED84423|nr:proteinase-activated receptor 1-like [Scatophagus argus]
MFSVRPNALLLALLCAAAASAAGANASARGRTFSLFKIPVTDEPIDPSEILGAEDIDKVNHSSGDRMRDQTNFETRISEEARLFLTGQMSTILIPSFYTLVCLISVPINICAVVAFGLRIRPKKATAIYMLNLACADLVFAALLPLKIAYHFGGNNWKFGAFMCRVVTAAFYWNMYCSVLLIASISVDRFLAVVYPIDSLAWRQPRRAVITCAAMWVLSFAGSVPLVFSEQTVRLSELNITTCHDVQPLLELIGHYKIYFITLCCVLFFLPLLITVTSYAWVIWSLSRVPHGVPGRSRRKTRAVVMAVTVLVMFVLCFMPTNCLLLTHYLQFNKGVEKSQEAPDGSYAAYLVFLCVGSLNCILDPLVYYFGSSQCRRQLARVLGCKKITEDLSSSNSHSSCRSSQKAILKPSRTEISKITTSDSLDKSLDSQYKKLLV